MLLFLSFQGAWPKMSSRCINIFSQRISQLWLVDLSQGVWLLSPHWFGSTPQPLVEYVPSSLLLAHNTLSSLQSYRQQILALLKCCWLHSHLHDRYQVVSYSDSSSHVERRNTSGNQANYQVCTIILCYWLNSFQHTLCIWVHHYWKLRDSTLWLRMCDEGLAQVLSRESKEKMSLSTMLRTYCAAHSYRFERILFAGEHWSAQKLPKHTKRVITLSHHLAQKITQRQQLLIHLVSMEKHLPICAVNTEDNEMALFSKKNDSIATNP